MLRVRTLKQYGLLLALLALLLANPAWAERVALVFGNSQYAHAPYLNNPRRDAEALARALTGLGFQVTGPLLNQSKAQMDAALKQFGRQAQGATAAAVYFSGHGVEVRGQNYLLPTDAVLERDRDVSLEAVGLEVVLDQIGGARDYRLVILDACRDNPLANTMRRSDGTRSAFRGLAPVEPSGQTYIAYAARAGQRAQDGPAGAHSPYAAALLKYLPQPGLPLERLFGSVREEVLRTTTRTQEPALYGTFGAAPIYLAGLVPEPVPVSPPPAVDHDLIAWQSAEKCGTAACFEAYLEDYPQGRYARMAKARLRAEPAVIASTAPAERSRPAFEPELVRIPGGCFQMGSPVSEAGRSSNERQHRVCVEAFEIGKYEVTQREWQAVMGNNPSRFKNGDRYPVEQVSWNDVQDYLHRMNQRTGNNYRLPTEAEWEYACRGRVEGQRYCGGNDVDRVAWYAGNNSRQTQPVGWKAANGFGLYDLSGNVWEWTCSLYNKDYGGAEQECNYNDTSAPRSLRGGSWDTRPAGVRSAYRDGLAPTYRSNLAGFRLARSL